MKFTKDNSCFICHRCLYTTHLKTNMKRHYERETLCDLYLSHFMGLSDNEQLEISCKKRYIFVEVDTKLFFRTNPLRYDILTYFITAYDGDVIPITQKDIDSYYNKGTASVPLIKDQEKIPAKQDAQSKIKEIDCSTIEKSTTQVVSFETNKDQSLSVIEYWKSKATRKPSKSSHFGTTNLSKLLFPQDNEIYNEDQEEKEEEVKEVKEVKEGEKESSDKVKLIHPSFAYYKKMNAILKDPANIVSYSKELISLLDQSKLTESQSTSSLQVYKPPKDRKKMLYGSMNMEDMMSLINEFEDETLKASLTMAPSESPQKPSNLLQGINETEHSKVDQSTDPTSTTSEPSSLSNVKEDNATIDSKEDDKSRHTCMMCGYVFCTKYRLINHIQNQKRCIHNRKMKLIQDKQKMFLQHQQQDQLQRQQSMMDFVASSTHIHNSMVNCGNTYNIQNIHNQTINNSTNLNNGNYLQVKLRDFINEGYNYDHVTKEDMKDEDFYVIKNFMRSIMKNDENKNIIFNKKNAIIFSGEGLHEIKKEDACMMLMDKLEECMEALMNREDADLEDIKKDILRYYSVMKLKYKCDTWHKTYDPSTRTFDNILHKGFLWTRDVCINELEKVCADFEEIVNKIFYDKGIKSNKRISTIPVTIYGMVPRRSRYKPEKDEY